MTPEPLDLDAIKTRADAATPGTWHEGDVWVFTDPIYEDDNRLSNVLGMTYSDPKRAGAEHQRALRNVRFIAHAREDVPALIAEVERLRALEQNARALHAERVIREQDHQTSRETGRTWSICTGCSSSDIIDALDDGELIEEYEGVPWPCATYSALNGEQASTEATL